MQQVCILHYTLKKKVKGTLSHDNTDPSWTRLLNIDTAFSNSSLHCRIVQSSAFGSLLLELASKYTCSKKFQNQ